MEEQPQQDSQEVSESSVWHKVKTVQDGKCEHDFMDDYIDAEGKQHQQCAKCMQGRWR